MTDDESSRRKLASLFERLDRLISSYPSQVVRVPRETGIVEGTAFFPGGYGLIRKPDGQLPEWPFGKIMVLGNDWGNEAGFARAQRNGDEASSSTWLGLLDLLLKCFGETFSLHECFFTNSFMGLRIGNQSAVGECPGRPCESFKSRCRDFLVEQLDVQRPRLVLTLGKYAAEMFSHVAGSLRHWRSTRPTLRRIDASGALQRNVAIDDLSDYFVTVCALTHPDRGHLNYKRRDYGAFKDEHELLEAALREAFPNR